jgi:uncharacterized membrane protein YtjA (UPF0391 family)
VAARFIAHSVAARFIAPEVPWPRIPWPRDSSRHVLAKVLLYLLASRRRLHGAGASTQEKLMLGWSLIFFIVAVVAAVLGFTGLAAGAASIAKLLFIVFLVLLVVSLVMDLARGRRPL